MKKLFLSLLVVFLFAGGVKADEGMWLPLLINERIDHMKSKGFELTAEDLYSINQASLKDAIVRFGRGCTGELVSNKGLILTNHHCGFGQIQSHSSVKNDYLRDGFWAMSMEEELPNRDLTVRFLKRMEDVTSQILNGYKSSMTEDERSKLVSENSKKVIAQAIKGTHYEASVEALYYGNQYFLFVYETYLDVRLVGAPPSSIGKFGGDTDNWMWPRHTGDFAIFRIYANKDNNPAPYSVDNVPYKPKKYFKISTQGVNEGDFTLVYGFPGRTQKYLHSQAVNFIVEKSNPHKINLRTLRLNVQKEEMGKSQEVRIKYASKNASVSNAWKKWQGETKGIIRLNTIQNKREFEDRFRVWAKDREQYRYVLCQMDSLYAQLEPYAFVADYFNEAIIANEILRHARSLSTIVRRSKNISDDQLRNLLTEEFESFEKDYYIPIDRRSFELLINEYINNIDPKYQPQYIKDLIIEKGGVGEVADFIFNNTNLVNSNKFKKLLEATNFRELIDLDVATIFYSNFNNHYSENIRPTMDSLNSNITLLYRTYMRGMMEFDTDREFYPDANSTLRITYGNVGGYRPKDGVWYKHQSTIEGIMQKDNPDIYDYNIPQKLRDLYSNRDFGQWTVDGTVPVCFIGTNHTSGGNSGSPVINSRGELIGINFDRVWEGTMSDIDFDPEMCRNITLDIRYVLFIVDKLAGASHLIDEMEIL